MIVEIKDGVRFSSPEAAMLHASLVMAFVCRDLNVDCVVTGGVEEHKHPSKHVYGGGLDYRTRDIPEAQGRRTLFASTARERLGDGFDVVLESDHLHVEYHYKD